jgi:outer membrane protein TolC
VTKPARGITVGCGSLLVLALCVTTSAGDPAVQRPQDQSKDSVAIDLPSALKLAGASNLDVQIARAQLASATAAKKVALEQFFPSISSGIAYRRHDGAIQNVEGDILNVRKENYAPGATVVVQTDLGEAIFRSLESRQLMNAAAHRLEAERQVAIVAAAAAYMDLVRAHASVRSSDEALRISSGYSDEVSAAVKIGLAFEGDALQAKGKSDEDRIAVRRAQEGARIAAVRLAAILNLDPSTILVPQDREPVPLAMFATSVTVTEQVAAALAARPEVKQRSAEVDAAREAVRGAKYGPLAPSIGGQVFAGGIGGGQDSGSHRFDDAEDYYVGLSWKLGPGGLFDLGRIEGSQARETEAEILAEKTRRDITAQVLAGRERVESLAAQVGISEKSLSNAREVLRLRKQREDFGVAAVLEVIQAQRDWTRSVDEYLGAITDYNKAQYELLHATGAL